MLRKTLGSNPGEWSDRLWDTGLVSTPENAKASDLSVSSPALPPKDASLASNTPKRKGLGPSF